MNSKIFTLKDPFIPPPTAPWTSYFERFLSTKQVAFLKVYVTHFPITPLSHMSTALYTHQGRAHLPPYWMPRASQSANHRVSGQQIFVKGLNLTANPSLFPAFDVCSEDTKLINIIQRQRLDISVSLRGFVTGQCSVIMNILKTD